MERLAELIRNELEADQAFSDETTTAIFNRSDESCDAFIRTREAGTFCGRAICHAVQEVLIDKLELKTLVNDGAAISPDETLVELSGPLTITLGVERTLLNLLSHSCGVATLTGKFVRSVEGLPTRILATRKTLPGLRELQLQAVAAGGGFVHRRSLSDGILIKDNHLMFVSARDAIQRARKEKSPLHRIEIEIQDLKNLDEVLEAKPDVIMLDNLPADEIKAALSKINRRCEVEISGGVTLENIRLLAEAGADYISVGRLTHSAPALNLSLDVFRK